MQRLTNDVREAIANKAVAHAFDPRRAALAEEADTLGRAAYAVVFPKSETDKLASVPENWIRRDACLRFNVGGQHIKLNLVGDGVPVPYRINGYAGYSCSVLGSIPHGDLCDKIQKHAVAVEKLKDESKAARQQLMAMLAKVSTFKRLRDIWPEGAQFFAGYEISSAAVPALRVDEINAMLGLAA